MSDLLKDLNQTLSEESKMDLGEESLQQDVGEEGVLGQLIGTIENINMAYSLLLSETKQTKQRLDALEKHVSFLLAKDPQFMEAFKKAQEEVEKK